MWLFADTWLAGAFRLTAGGSTEARRPRAPRWFPTAPKHGKPSGAFCGAGAGGGARVQEVGQSDPQAAEAAQPEPLAPRQALAAPRGTSLDRDHRSPRVVGPRSADSP